MRTPAAERCLLIVLVVLVGPWASGCAKESERNVGADAARALIGTWTAEDTTRFVFADAGEALWIFGEGADEDTFEIRYEYGPDMEPAHLDLSGFDRGFLRGRTLFCIVSLDAGTQFELDCEPGGPEAGDVRPDTFTRTTMTYRANPLL